MILIGAAAPLLGTISPSEINPTVRNRPPGFERTIRADDGSQRAFTAWMGTDSLGPRHLQPRRLRGARLDPGRGRRGG